MHEDLIKRLRELQAITKHCDEQSCDECENRKLCDKYDNKTLSGTYKEAADVIEELAAYVQQLEGNRKTVTQKTEMIFDNPNEKEENLPFLPLMLLAAFQSNLKEFDNRKQTDEEMRQNCPSIEWEQDMGAHIPFCKIYGGMCNMQCLQNK